MFALKDIVTWTHPRSGKTHTGVIVHVYQLNGSERYVVQVCVSGRVARATTDRIRSG